MYLKLLKLRYVKCVVTKSTWHKRVLKATSTAEFKVLKRSEFLKILQFSSWHQFPVSHSVAIFWYTNFELKYLNEYLLVPTHTTYSKIRIVDCFYVAYSTKLCGFPCRI